MTDNPIPILVMKSSTRTSQILFLLLGFSLLSSSSNQVLSGSGSGSQVPKSTVTSNSNSNPNSNPTHSHSNKTNIAIGHLCHHDAQCANSSICSMKQYQDGLMLKVCQCDPNHMNRVGWSCFVKPGYQCYYPGKDEHGRTLLKCMVEAECRSGVNKSAPGNGYCMCNEEKDDEPFRALNVDNEIWRCDASSIFYPKGVGFFGVFVMLFLSFSFIF